MPTQRAFHASRSVAQQMHAQRASGGGGGPGGPENFVRALCGVSAAAVAAAAACVHCKSDPKSKEARFLVSTAAERGARASMEDRLFVSDDGTFVGMFDGHGGAQVAAHLAEHAHASFANKLQSQGNFLGRSDSNQRKDMALALSGCVREMEEQVLRRSAWDHQGSTAALICVDGQSIWAAGVGDSRAVLSRGGEAVELTEDHKPNNKEDQARIEALGGSVDWIGWTDPEGRPVEGMGSYRVNGNLAISRSIGDKDEKPYICSEPTIKRFDWEHAHDEFVVVATDGLWDVLESDECVNFVHSALKVGEESWSGKQHDFQAIYRRRKQCMAQYLAEEAMRRGSLDNVAVAILWLS